METREPSGFNSRADYQVSPFRARMAQITALPDTCPAEVRELLGPLSIERVKYPPCPPNFEAAVQAARGALSLDEITVLEEFLNAQCRLNPREPVPEMLAALMRPEHTPRHSAGESDGDEAKAVAAAEARLRETLRGALLEARAAVTPIDLWVRNNGEFVFPEEQLEFFDRLAVQDTCRMTDQEVDLSYRTIRSLEELARIEPDNDTQRERIERFLGGIHKVLDRKIQEFFR